MVTKDKVSAIKRRRKKIDEIENSFLVFFFFFLLFRTNITLVIRDPYDRYKLRDLTFQFIVLNFFFLIHSELFLCMFRFCTAGTLKIKNNNDFNHIVNNRVEEKNYAVLFRGRSGSLCADSKQRLWCVRANKRFVRTTTTTTTTRQKRAQTTPITSPSRPLRSMSACKCVDYARSLLGNYPRTRTRFYYAQKINSMIRRSPFAVKKQPFERGFLFFLFHYFFLFLSFTATSVIIFAS